MIALAILGTAAFLGFFTVLFSDTPDGSEFYDAFAAWLVVTLVYALLLGGILGLIVLWALALS